VPTAVLTVVFFVAPLALIAVYSFGSVDPVSLDVFFGWTTNNYRAFGSTLYLHSLLRSVFLSLGATAICAVLGFSLAYFIARQPPRAQRLLLVAVIVPFWTSFIVRTYSWVDLLQNLGPIDRLAGAIGLTNGHLSILYVSLERIDDAIYSAAADLGATPWRQFRKVVLPLAMPGVIAGSIIVGIPALGEYVIPEILGGGKTLMFGNILADQFQNTGNYPFGSALAVTLMGVLLILLFVMRRRQPLQEGA
jgi:spermidine/putrescine transport system permease protein